MDCFGVDVSVTSRATDDCPRPVVRTRRWWLDNRAKEAIGRALLSSPGTVMYCQCDTFVLTEETTTLPWTSKQACDAVVLAGVLRSNTVLRTLNVGAGGELDDYCREEIGMAILSNVNGKLGYSDIFGLKDGGSPNHTIDIKDKDQVCWQVQCALRPLFSTAAECPRAGPLAAFFRALLRAVTLKHDRDLAHHDLCRGGAH